MTSHSTAGGSLSGVHWKQFIAECGIEYGCQFVTQFFLNPPDCLYTKKSWEILQSYEKSSAKQRNSFLFLPRRSNFAVEGRRVTQKNERKKQTLNILTNDTKQATENYYCLARWLDNWTIGQNLNSIGTDGANDKNLIILYIIIYNIINII